MTKTHPFALKPMLVLLWLVLTCHTVNSQEFAFISKEQVDNAPAPATSYKYTVAAKVFNQLLQARGDFSIPAPALVMKKSEHLATWLDRTPLQIGLEEKAYDACTGFGADSINALAALLAHELCHYYDEIRLGNIRDTVPAMERLKQEAEADFVGSFWAESAGYKPQGIQQVLLKKIYEVYQLPEIVPGYPALPERMEAAKNAFIRAKDLKTQSEMARLLHILGHYNDAAAYYSNIAATYPGRDVVNNAALNAILAALELFPPKEIPFVMPMELNAALRLSRTGSPKPDALEERKKWLETAVRQCDQVLAFDENFVPGYLEKGCALALLGAREEAETWLQKGIKKCPTSKSTTDFLVMSGIAAALKGDKVLAQKQLEKAKNIGSFLATTNLNILLNTVPATPVDPGPAPVKGVEKIEWFSLPDFLANPQPDRHITVGSDIRCGVQERQQSNIYFHSKGNKTVVVQETGAGYKGTSMRGITLISSADNVQEAYGVPTGNFATPEGRVWVFDKQKIFFCFNQRLVLQSWGVYLESN